jgi:hypothetical protein
MGGTFSVRRIQGHKGWGRGAVVLAARPVLAAHRELQRIVFTKTTSAPSDERSATDFVKFVHSVSFYPASTASYWNLPTNVQPASSQLPQAAASYRAAPCDTTRWTATSAVWSVCYPNEQTRPFITPH